MTKILRLTQPTSEPVTVGQAKDHCRVDFYDSDAEIQAMISTARERAENFCNRAFCEATFAMLCDGNLPTGKAAVSVPMPGATVTAVTYLDSDSASQTLSDYTFDAERGTVTPDDAWPSGTSLRVAFTAGDDGEPPVVPAPVFSAILLYVGELFDLRSAQVEGTTLTENASATNLLMPYRVEMGV